MNSYQKAIERGIEKGLDNHFSKKVPKKVVLTADEVFILKQMVRFVLKSSRLINMNKAFLEKNYNFLNDCFEQAEKGNAKE